MAKTSKEVELDIQFEAIGLLHGRYPSTHQCIIERHNQEASTVEQMRRYPAIYSSLLLRHYDK